MTRDRDGDINRKFRVIVDEDVWQQPNGIVKTKYPGKLVGPRWYYRDNPINGVGEKEYANHFRYWENKPPKEVIDEV